MLFDVPPLYRRCAGGATPGPATAVASSAAWPSPRPPPNAGPTVAASPPGPGPAQVESWGLVNSLESGGRTGCVEIADCNGFQSIPHPRSTERSGGPDTRDDLIRPGILANLSV